MKRTAIFTALAILAASCCTTTPKAYEGPHKVIIETDMGNDIDDALALAVALKAANAGEIELLAVGCHKMSETPAKYVDIVNTYYGQPQVEAAMSVTPVKESSSYEDYFRSVAAERNTKVVCVDPDTEIDDDYINQFPYMVFKNNCAIGLGFARALGIDEDLAKRAMLMAHPDPGATQIVQVNHGEDKCYLVNAFAANEPESSLEIMQKVRESTLPQKDLVLILCCRDDRVDRSHQFSEDFLPYVQAKTMLVIGTGALEIIHAFKKGMYPGIEECIDLSGQKADVIIDEVHELMSNNIFLCAGNIHGSAEEFLEDFAAIRI